MDQNESMGFVETIGLASAIEAADVMVKSANVKIETVANADAGLITVICTGDLASCNAAVNAAKAAVGVIGKTYNSHQIPRPSSDVQRLIGEHVDNMIETKKAAQPKPPTQTTRKAKK